MHRLVARSPIVTLQRSGVALRRCAIALLAVAAVHPLSAHGTFEQPATAPHVVAMEAESFQGNTAQGGHSWSLATGAFPAGFSGNGAMEAVPNDGTSNKTNYVTLSPRLDFAIDFAATGAHYIWVRGFAWHGGDNSVHFGLDGAATPGADNISIPTGEYAWSTNTGTIDIASPGLHTVNLWMREDGIRVDKIVITTDPGFVPSGQGPSETAQTGDNVPPTARDDTFAVDQDSAGNALAVLADNGSGADFDTDGGNLSVVGVGATSNGGSAAVNAAGDAVVYTPAAGFTGAETFAYTLSDGTDTDQATVTVTVNAVGGGNQAPVARDDAFAVDQDTVDNALAVLADNGNGADSDADGDSLSVVAVGTPGNGGTAAANGTRTGILYSPAAGFTGTETFTYTVGDGTDTDQATVTVTVNSTGGGGGGDGAFQQSVGGDHIVSMEAESFHGNTAQGAHQWVAEVSPPGGFSGTGAMVTTPDVEDNVSDFVNLSPRLDFQVNFATTGVHYLHVRGYWRNGKDDSVHVGLNGQAVASAADVHYAFGSEGYVWSSVTRTITVDSTGLHTVNVWMREDATPFDKIVLTTSSAFVPSGAGPAESGRTGSTANLPPEAQDDLFAVDQDTADNAFAVLADNGDGMDTDPDGDTLSVVAVGTPGNGGTAVVNGTQTGILYTPAPGFSGTETFTYTVSDGTDTDQASVTVTVRSSGGGGSTDGAFQQSVGGDYVVSMEAENYHLNTAQGAHQWVAEASPPGGFSGTGAMVTTPDVEDNVSNFVNLSPRLDFLVNFATTGVHHVHVRGYWRNGKDDSVHVGLNGQAVASAADVHYAAGTQQYVWNSVTRTITVDSTGLHTVNVWMREDATPFDKIVLTTSSAFVPSGAGPAESGRTGGNLAPVARDDTFAVDQDSADNALAVLADNGNGADTDPDGGTLSVVSVSAASNGGTAVVNGTQTGILYTPAAGFTGTETFTYTVSDGTDSDQASVAVTVRSSGGGGGAFGPFQQQASGDFLVSMEAENFHLNTPQGVHQWQEMAGPPDGFSGSGLMESTPNLGDNISNYVTQSPRLDFEVDFTTTGTHYLHVRGIWLNGKDDSVHLGLNGVAVPSAADVHYAFGTSGYVWSSVTRSFDVTSIGVHTVNVWMREDGTPLDKIVLTTNPDFLPSGSGPVESAREALCATFPSVSLVSPVTGHLQSASDLEVDTITCLDAQDHATWGIRIAVNGGADAGGQEAFRFSPPYTATFSGLPKAEHSVEAVVVDGAGDPVDGGSVNDLATEVGIGDYYVAIGDSITNGEDDDIAADDVSADGRDDSGGYQPILNDLLTTALSYPHTVKNEGVGGITSAGGLDRLPLVMADHPEASRYLVKYGMNDARPWLPVPSGLGLQPGDSGYPGTFKDNMQQIIDMLQSAGKEAVLAKVNIALGDGANSEPYPDPDQGARSLLIKEYNQVIDELIAVPGNDVTIAPPDFYSYFQVHADTEYSDNIHPNGIGYQSMANLWFEVIVQ